MKPREWLHYTCALAALSTLGTVGCRSAKSTHVEPDPYKGGWKTKHLRGVPVTVKVPTHIEVRIVKKHYIQPNTKLPLRDKDGITVSVLEIEHTIREKDEVFTVDAVRPGAGTLDYNATFDNQYFRTFTANSSDVTLETIATTVDTLKGLLPTGKSTSGKVTAEIVDDAEGVIPYLREIVAIKVFDVYDPNPSACMKEFINTFVCPDCKQPNGKN
jgi:hypothetical protein